ncbi:hypothetical protein [Streptomyces sp. CB09001]|uniref:hypothetical protein n=1 Tax=Streptomyces sp. CB09001 TaxID=2083284 RepID=UPI0013BE9391|nr:hypothetical protein [Streptomyces sp. CB09001]
MSTVVLGELLKRLRLVAVGGVVPEAEFTQGVRTLGLSDDERARLRAELARVGLLVRGLHMHVKVDSSNSEKVVGAREENVTTRVLLARGLLSRYEDGTGYLSAQRSRAWCDWQGSTPARPRSCGRGSLCDLLRTPGRRRGMRRRPKSPGRPQQRLRLAPLPS